MTLPHITIGDWEDQGKDKATSGYYGFYFTATIDLKYVLKKPPSECRLEWWEWSYLPLPGETPQ
ncbi:MAG TPA: hypothetical protein VN648_30465, partial [Candidatus Methylomirabilis sp.]|nr:hypothetical protein [Candidatus Methylomirabilis sp.]